MQTDQLLLLNYTLYANRVNDFLTRMNNEPRFMDAFMLNPIEVGYKEIFQEDSISLTTEAVYQSNRLLYTILSNQNYVNWAKNYQIQLITNYRNTGVQPDKLQIMRDTAQAFIDHGDQDMLMSLLLGQKDSNIENVETQGIFTHTNTVYTTHASMIADVAVGVVYFTIFLVISQIDLTPIIAGKEDLIPVLTPAELQAISDTIIAQANTLRANNKLNKDCSNFNDSPSYN